MQSVITMSVGLEIAKCGTDQLTCAQARCVCEIKQKSQLLSSRCRPAIRPFKAVRDGAHQQPFPFGKSPCSPQVFNFIMKRRQLAGSLIGGIAETQEMLDFCAEHNITSDVEIIPTEKINEAYERMLRSDVKYRFVIDMASLQDEG